MGIDQDRTKWYGSYIMVTGESRPSRNEELKEAYRRKNEALRARRREIIAEKYGTFPTLGSQSVGSRAVGGALAGQGQPSSTREVITAKNAGEKRRVDEEPRNASVLDWKLTRLREKAQEEERIRLHKVHERIEFNKRSRLDLQSLVEGAKRAALSAKAKNPPLPTNCEIRLKVPRTAPSSWLLGTIKDGGHYANGWLLQSGSRARSFKDVTVFSTPTLILTEEGDMYHVEHHYDQPDIVESKFKRATWISKEHLPMHVPDLSVVDHSAKEPYGDVYEYTRLLAEFIFDNGLSPTE